MPRMINAVRLRVSTSLLLVARESTCKDLLLSLCSQYLATKINILKETHYSWNRILKSIEFKACFFETKTLSTTSTAVCTRGASILLAVNWTSEQCRGWRARQIYSTWRVVILCRLLDRSREIITAKLIRLPPIRRTAHIVASRSSHCRLYKKKHFFCYFWSMHSFSIFVSAWIW